MSSGNSIRNLHVDWLTMSEVLRLHLLTSGLLHALFNGVIYFEIEANGFRDRNSTASENLSKEKTHKLVESEQLPQQTTK